MEEFSLSLGLRRSASGADREDTSTICTFVKSSRKAANYKQTNAAAGRIFFQGSR